MSRLKLSGLSKRYGGFLAVDGIDLELQNGEFVSLLGPSGCGKTTTLRMIAGLSTPVSAPSRWTVRFSPRLPARFHRIGAKCP